MKSPELKTQRLPHGLSYEGLSDEVNIALESGLRSLITEEPRKLSEWADEFFYLSAESSNVQGRWETLPYQRAIMNVIGNDDVRVVTLMKAARVGYTKILMAAIAYFTVHRRRNQLIYQPTNDDAEAFVKTEIDPMIRDVPALRALLRCNPEVKSSLSTLSEKFFVGSTLHVLGAGTARNFRRWTKDVVGYDELDGFDRDIDGEGAPTTLGDKRTSGSSFPKSIRGSTPRVKGMSLIEESFDEADKRFYRMLLCPHCDHYFALSWKLVTFKDHDPTTAMCGCGKCGVLFGYDEYPAMDRGGRWQADDGTWINDEDDNFYDENDLPVSPPRHVAFHVSALYSYYFPWADAVDEFLKANAEKRKGNRTKMKTFVNTVLGESSEEDKADTPQWFDLKSRAENYEVMTVPLGPLILTMGVDVQNDRLAVALVGTGRGEESWRIWQGELYGDPLHVDVWNQLTELIERPYPRSGGGVMRISLAGIDSGGGRTQAVYDYCRNRAPRIMALKGMSQPGKPIIGRPTNQDVVVGGITIPDGVKLWPVGSDTAKSQIYGRVRVKENGPGKWHFPIGMRDEYYQQLVSEQLFTRFHKGVPYQEWKLPSGSRNEALDCEVYALAVTTLLINDPRFSWDSIEKQLVVQCERGESTPQIAPEPIRRKRKASDNSWVGPTGDSWL